MAQNLYPTALLSYKQATRLHPAFGDAYNNMGNCQLALHDYAGSIVSYRFAVRANPLEANYYCNLGSAVARYGCRAGRLSPQSLTRGFS